MVNNAFRYHYRIKIKKEPSTTRFLMLMTLSLQEVSTRAEKPFINFAIL